MPFKKSKAFFLCKKNFIIPSKFFKFNFFLSFREKKKKKDFAKNYETEGSQLCIAREWKTLRSSLRWYLTEIIYFFCFPLEI